MFSVVWVRNECIAPSRHWNTPLAHARLPRRWGWGGGEGGGGQRQVSNPIQAIPTDALHVVTDGMSSSVASDLQEQLRRFFEAGAAMFAKTGAQSAGAGVLHISTIVPEFSYSSCAI